MKSDLYRKLPSVDEVLRTDEVQRLCGTEGKSIVTDAVRAALSRLRTEVTSGQIDDSGVDLALTGLAQAIVTELHRALANSLRPVINATGVILHTNLGRAPLSSAALEHIRETAATYSNLEFNLENGERGKRDIHVDRLFRRVLNAELQDGALAISTIVVNNNAAAVLLALNSLAQGGEVIVSRGELVEIGGSFRIPDVMAKSQAILREVGTTNRTRIPDYENAITGRTRLLLRVHRSNFEITGFTEQPDIAQLVELGRKHNLPVLEDLGSGALIDLHSVGIPGEPSVLDSLRAGVDVVSYSGDKLLGGPQAGLLSGRADLIQHMRSNSLFRALRVDKLTYAALEATLLAYARRDHDAIPALRMMRTSKQDVRRRAEAMANVLRSSRLHINILDSESIVGGGAAPSTRIPTAVIAASSSYLTADELALRLRGSDPPIISRVEDGRVLIDLRTVFPHEDQQLANSLQQIADSTDRRMPQTGR